MAAKLIVFQAIDYSGTPLSGAKLYVYQAGTTTPISLYQTPSLSGGASATNPVIATSSGMAAAWFDDAVGDVKIIARNSADTITYFGQDNMAPVDRVIYPLGGSDQETNTDSSVQFATLTLTGALTVNGVTIDPSGATVGQALGFPNSATTAEPYTPAGAGDTLSAANETITGTWGYEAPVYLTLNVAQATLDATTYKDGSRGPVLIWNNVARDDIAAGYCSGLKINVAGTLTATPGVNGAVAFQTIVTNEEGRQDIWSGNALALQDASGADGLVHGFEFETATVKSAEPDPFGGGSNPRKDGIEIVHHSGSTLRGTAAAWLWSANSAETAWWHNGIAMSRIAHVGIRAGVWTGDTATDSFQTAFILDESQSAAVLKVNNDHAAVFDLSDSGTLTHFVKGKSGAETALNFDNDADYAMNLVLDAGSTATQQKAIIYGDRGTAKWGLIGNAGGGANFALFNYATSASSIFVYPDDEIEFAGGLSLASGHTYKIGGTAVVGAQQTTAVAEAAFVENSGGTAVNVDSTFGGYTLQQVVQALQNHGLLA